MQQPRTPVPYPLEQLRTLVPTASGDLVHLGPLELHRSTVQLLGQLLSSALAIVATIALANVLLRAVPWLEGFVVRLAADDNKKDDDDDGKKPDEKQVFSSQRVETLVRVTGSVARAGIWGAAVVAVLGTLGIAVGPLLAGAGIAGVAVGFGAQSIVKDFFAGFFILLENQFAVGDTITVAGVTGTVEVMTMRVTVLRDTNGTAYFIPNSSITTVANKTYGWAKVVVDVTFASSISSATARSVLDTVAKLVNEGGYEEWLLEPLTAEGPVELMPGGFTFRVSGKARALKALEVRSRILDALNTTLEENTLLLAAGVVDKKK